MEKAPRPATIKREVASQAPSLEKLGHEYPEVHTSTIDINGDPIYAPAEKPVTELDFDAGELGLSTTHHTAADRAGHRSRRARQALAPARRGPDRLLQLRL